MMRPEGARMGCDPFMVICRVGIMLEKVIHLLQGGGS